MLPSLLTKSTKTAASNALSGSVTAPFRVRRCCYSAPLLEQVLRSSKGALAVATATSRGLTFRDDHHHSTGGRRRCYHTLGGSSPTTRRVINTAALLLRAANESARLFWSASPFSTSTSSSTASSSGGGGGKSPASSQAKHIFKQNDKIESYFSAIGGSSDAPPPSLTPREITRILRTNESLIFNVNTARENELFIHNFLDVLGSASRRSTKSRGSSKGSRKFKSTEAASSVSQAQLYRLIDNPWVTSVESNQLASNHPIEDRLRVATLNIESVFPSSQSIEAPALQDNCMAFGVFDGHNGGHCADVISRRLFHYITIALAAYELRSSSSSGLPRSSMKAAFSADILGRLARDHSKSPRDYYHNIHVIYEDAIAEKLQARIEEFEWRSLEQFAQEELEHQEADDLSREDQPEGAIESSLRRAFLACDRDLSREIQVNLLNTSSNVLLHYYLSLAVSGACATVVLLYQNDAYIASTGDCRAVMGTLKQSELQPSESCPEGSEQTPSSQPITRKILKSTDLSFEHNSENIRELNRLMSEHPKEEANYLIRDNRLLGQLMPVRAFGDFSFKWSVEKMKQLGLTRAFGSHIIPTHYKTPPYLTAEPEITKLCLADDGADSGAEEGSVQLDRFIILATDGLWEQFEGARKVVKAVNRYRQSVRQQIKAFTSANLFKIGDSNNGNNANSNTSAESASESDTDDSPLTLGKIVDRLRVKVTDPPVAIFERITADDDLIEDINCGTFLLRTALSDASAPGGGGTSILEEEEKFSHHVDQVEQQRAKHAKLVSYLTLPQSVARNFRDDISLIVIGLK